MRNWVIVLFLSEILGIFSPIHSEEPPPSKINYNEKLFSALKSKDPTSGLLGIGFSAIPLSYTSNRGGTSLYQGGMQLDGFWQKLPWFRLGISVSGTGHTELFSSHFFYGELSVSPQIRLFAPWIKKAFTWGIITPYVVVKIPIQVAFSSFPLLQKQQTFIDQIYLGAQVGLGLEMRLFSRFLLSADVKGLFRAGLRPAIPSFIQGGIQIELGFGYVFEGSFETFSSPSK